MYGSLRTVVYSLALAHVLAGALARRRDNPDNLLLPNFLLSDTSKEEAPSARALETSRLRVLRQGAGSSIPTSLTSGGASAASAKVFRVHGVATQQHAESYYYLPSDRPSSLHLAAAPAPAASSGNPLMSKSPTASPSPAPAESTGGSPRRKEQNVLDKWFTWRFWQLMVVCVATILLFSDILGPLIHRFLLKPSFLLDSTIFAAQMVTLMLVAAALSEPGAAGGANTRALATVMASISVLLVLGALSLRFQKLSSQAHHVMDDVATLFRPFSRILAIFLIVHGVLEESSADWGNLVLFGSFVALGVAFAMTGFVQNVISYCFIRLDDYFKEGDWVYYQNELYQVRNIYWRYTLAYRLKTRSMAYIPNREIGQLGVNNQSRDNARCWETHLPLPMGMPSASLEAVVKGAWQVLKGVEEAGFAAQNGQLLDCQFDVSKSSIWIDGIDTAPSSKEFAALKLHMKLFGKYYFSKPPHWQKEGPEPEPCARQLDWQAGWNYQLEWFIIEVKKLVEKHSSA